MATYRNTWRAAAALVMVATTLATSVLCPLVVLAGDPGTIDTVAGSSSDNGFSGDEGPAIDAEFYDPMGITLDAWGNIWIADFRNHRVRMIPAEDGTLYGQDMTAGYVYTIAGTGTEGYSGDGSAATDATLKYPEDIAVDTNGNVYIADSNNHRIRRVSTAGVITTLAGTGSAFHSGDGSAAINAALNFPRGVWYAQDSLFIADEMNHCIRMIPFTGGTYFGQVMNAGYIYTIAGKPMDSGYSGDGGVPTNAELTMPNSVYVDAGANLYIADKNNQVVRMIPATTGTHYGISMTAGYIYTIAGTGQDGGYEGDGGTATSAKLYQPHDIAVDADGDLYFTDHGNHCIREVTAGGTISTYAGTGEAGFSGDGDAATSAQLDHPNGIFVDDEGVVFFADCYNDRIRQVFPGEAETNVEGDANGDGTTNIVDAMFIAQYSVGLRTLDETQLLCADTTDEGMVNIIDAMHVAQFSVDPTGAGGVLYKQLWETPADDALIDPLDL
ncbi:MAG: dockerin type I domain-containing protein [Dehalococcoidia bacterium]|jgi:sugar lactone lactonase YvrE|nr:dockerin type I domain-containing protein [Dehalococcoidia bacterium]